jgi:hypothetical protein
MQSKTAAARESQSIDNLGCWYTSPDKTDAQNSWMKEEDEWLI